MSQEIKNILLHQLSRHSARDLQRAIAERESEILEDIAAAREELEEGKPLVFSFSFSGKMLFDKNKIETIFSYSVKKSCKAEHPITNPDEPEFKFEGGEG